MQLKKYDIILCKNSNTFISKIIRFFTNDKYSHSQLYLGDNHIIDTLYPRGVKIKHINRQMGYFDVFRYKYNITQEQSKKIDEFIQKKINTKYDLIELFFQIFKVNVGDKDEYTCISLITEAFNYAGINLGVWKDGFKNITESKDFIIIETNIVNKKGKILEQNNIRYN